MSIEKAKEAHKSLLKTASKFISPSLKEYFRNKADSSFERIKDSKNESVFQKYISEQNELNNVLDRVVGVYNMYRDDRSTL